MELVDISKLLYEMTRTKEDRLLMKWEDDRGRLIEEIHSLSSANHSATETIRRQSDEYNALIQTISNFGVKSSPRRTSQYVNSKVSTNKKTPADSSPEDFITIDRSKTTKKGPLHSFFNTAGGRNISTKTCKKSSSARNAAMEPVSEVWSSEGEAELHATHSSIGGNKNKSSAVLARQGLKTSILAESAQGKTAVSSVRQADKATMLAAADCPTQPVPPVRTHSATAAPSSSLQQPAAPFLASSSITAPAPVRALRPLPPFLPDDAGGTCSLEEQEQEEDLDCTRISEPDLIANPSGEQPVLLVSSQQSLPADECESQTTCGSQRAAHSAVKPTSSAAPLLWTSASRRSSSAARTEGGCSPTQSPPHSQDLLCLGAAEGEESEGEDSKVQAFPAATCAAPLHEIIDLSDSPNKENRSYEKERANMRTEQRTENAEKTTKLPKLFSPSLNSDFAMASQYDGGDSAAGSSRKIRSGKRANVADPAGGDSCEKRRKEERHGTSTTAGPVDQRGSSAGTGKRVSYAHHDEISNNHRNSSVRTDKESRSSSTSAAPKRDGRPAVDPSKCVESVRSRTLRAALPGFACEECARFYETMQQQGESSILSFSLYVLL